MRAATPGLQPSSICPPRRSRRRLLICLISAAAEIAEVLGLQNQLRGNRRRILAAVKTDPRSRAFEQHRHRNRGFIKWGETQVPGVAAQLVVKDGLFMLTDDL